MKTLAAACVAFLGVLCTPGASAQLASNAASTMEHFGLAGHLAGLKREFPLLNACPAD